METKKYIIITSTKLGEVENDVASAIENGYKLVGGVSISGSKYAQAMIKDE